VGEFSTVEVVSDRLSRQAARALKPHEARGGVDEPLDQPCACQAVHPWILARRPCAGLILRAIGRPELAARYPRLTPSINLAVIALQRRNRVRGLGFRRAGKKVQGVEPVVLALQPLEAGLRFARTESTQAGAGILDSSEQRCVLGAAVEQAGQTRPLVRGLEVHLDPHGKTAAGADLGSDFLERGACRWTRGQHVHAIAQYAAADVLQGTPCTHPHGRVARRQAENQRIEDCHPVIGITD